MTSTTESSEVLAQDTRGRVRVSRERREALLAEFDKSGMSAARFAAWAGVNYQTFAGWVQRRRRDRANRAESVVARGTDLRWVEAVVADPGVELLKGTLVVHLPGGAHLEVKDGASAMLAGELMRVLLRGRAGC